MLRRSRRIHADRKAQKNAPWLLAFLVFLAATVPSVQLVRQASSDTLTIELCATRGQAANQVAAVQIIDTAPGLPAKHSARPHCPLCITPESTVSLPPLSNELKLARIEHLERVRVLSGHEPPSPPQRSKAQSRAPPALA